MNPLPMYKAMADESRLRIVSVLGAGAFNVQELTSILELSQSTVSHHLRTLQQAGMVRSSRDGTWAFYSLRSDEPASASITQSFLELVRRNGSEALGAYSSDRRKAATILERRRDSTRRFFDSVAKDWQALRHEVQGNEDAFVEFAARIPKDLDFIELGCGSGALLGAIMPRSGMTVAVDYSMAMLDEARMNVGDQAARIDFRLGFLEHLPVADLSADMAGAYMVFHHLADPREALRDAFRVLRHGGRLLIADLLQHGRESMRERFADVWLGFDPAQFAAWLKEAGFHHIQPEIIGEKKEVFIINAIKS